MRRATFVTTISMIVLGTFAFAQSVTYDFDKTTDFSKLKTYAWVRGTNLEDPLNHNRVVQAIDLQLALKGFAMVDRSANPDVLVAYHASFDKNLEINGYSTGWGPYGLRGSRTGTARVQEVLVGTLVVEMVKAATDTVAWRGMASMDVDINAKPEKREKSINKAAAKLFKNYPGTN